METDGRRRLFSLRHPRTSWLSGVTLMAALVATGTSAAAAEVASASLDSLLAVALSQSPRIQALQADYRSALERVPQAGALPDPMLSYTAEGAPLRQPSPTQAAMHRIGISQMFPFPGKRGLQRSAMGAEAEMARARQDRGRLEVAAELRRAFYDLYLLYNSVDVLEESRAIVRTFAQVARTRYEVGSAMQQDLLMANVELARETNQLTILRARIPAAAGRIQAILGRPENEPLGRPALGDTAAAWPGLAQLEQAALAQQPMLHMKDQAVGKGQYSLRLARKAALPDFTVGLEYMGQKDMPDAWAGMLGVSLPIWRGGKVAPARREAEQSLASARADREQARSDLLSMIRDAWTQLTTSQTLVNLYRDSVLPQAEMSLASTRAAYETGRIGFLNLLDAQRSLLQMRLEYQTAIADYLKSRADLGLAVGDPLLLGANND